jgi:chitodextrinase
VLRVAVTGTGPCDRFGDVVEWRRTATGGRVRGRRVSWTATRGTFALLALVACLAGAADGTAAVRPWPGGRIAFQVASPGLRGPVLQAAREWNASGARVHLVERASATLVVRAMPRRSCFGVVGFAPLGALPPGYRGTVQLQPGCSRFELVSIAAHELGHVLGLGHDDRHCSVMNSVGDQGCHDVVYPWEYRCHPLEAVDIRRAVALYGGRAPRRPTRTLCLSKPTPTPARGVAAQANPSASLAATRITWRNPPSRSLRRVIVNRLRGNACPTYPSTGGLLVPARVSLRAGETVADLDAREFRGRPQEAFDVADVEAGRWCYAVWAIGPAGRYARAGTVRVRHPGIDRSPGRIALAAIVAPVAGVRVRLTWTNPTAPVPSSIVVLREAGPCPTDPSDLRGTTVATVPVTPGPAATDDADPMTPGGTWCYAVDFQDEATFTARRVLLEVPGVPEPPNAPPVAAFTPSPTEGTTADEIWFADGSSDPDGSIVAWAWDFGDGTTGTGRDVPHLYALPGTYTVTLTVTDDRGATGTTTGTILITP